MSSLLSKVGMENGYVRRINIALFGDMPEVAAKAATATSDEVHYRAAHDGAAFVLAETSPEAVAEYASLRANGKKPADAFAQAFVNYFAADHDVIDLHHAAAIYDKVAPGGQAGTGPVLVDSAAYAHNAAAAFSGAIRANEAKEAEKRAKWAKTFPDEPYPGDAI